MKPEIPPRIDRPCPKSWSEMAGDAKRRFCDECQLHVHDLSEMTASERRRFLASDDRKCVIYTVDAKGALVSQIQPRWFLTLLSRLRVAFVTAAAAVLPFGLSSCATRQTMGSPAPPTSDKCTTKVSTGDENRTVVPGMILPPDSR